MKKSIDVNLTTGVAIFLGLLIIAAVIYFGGLQGWFKSEGSNTYTNDSITNMLNQAPNNPTGQKCRLYLNETEVCTGDLFEGEIVTMSNILCSVFAYDGSLWSNIYIGYTDGSGVIKEEGRINTPGTYTFIGVCDTTRNGALTLSDCFTNRVELIVEDCVDDSDDSDDSDDDYSGYTCGLSEWCPSGTCPIEFSCVEINYMQSSFCACVDDDGNVHPYWKPDFEEEEEEVEQTIGQYCVDLGYDKHWDTYCESNCIQGAINECGVDSYEYFWDDVKEWCCYKCII